MNKLFVAVSALAAGCLILPSCGGKRAPKPKQPALPEEPAGKQICRSGEVLSSFPLQNGRGYTINEHYPLSEASGTLKVLSGGQATVTPEGRLLTISGDIDAANPWFKAYSANADTLFGRRPQNIFRLYMDTCLLSSKTGFYVEAAALATDYRPPEQPAYLGGVDLIAQWWSPGNPNQAFLCKDQYGGFCGNMGYHTKIKSDGMFEISRERPAQDTDAAHRYESVARLAKVLYTQSDQFPINKPVRLRMEITEKEGAVSVTSCFDDNADGSWDKTLTAKDDKRPITGYFVAILRSDWMSAEFFEPRIGVPGPGQKSCSEK